MRRENLYLSDAMEAIASIENFLADVHKKEFVGNDLIRSAVLQKLTVIGEAAARLPKPFRDAHREVDWANIVAFRNLAVHAYFAIDWSIVWTTATKDVPALKKKLLRILSTYNK